MIDVAAARAKAEGLKSAALQIQLIVAALEKAIGYLKEGATANRIKIEVAKLESIKNSLNSKVSTLNSVAGQIVTIANQIKAEEEAARQAFNN